MNPVAIWHGAIEKISPHASPCRHLAPARWSAIRESAIDFCERFSAEAYRLGWTAPQLFSVHPQHGTLRLDYCGVMMVSGNRAEAVVAQWIVFERGSGRRDKAGQKWGIPIWEFAAKGPEGQTPV